MVVSLTSALPRCKRCGGQMYLVYEGEHTCLWCGEVAYPPPPRLHGDEDIDAWRLRLRGKPGRPRRQPLNTDSTALDPPRATSRSSQRDACA